MDAEESCRGAEVPTQSHIICWLLAPSRLSSTTTRSRRIR